MSKFNSNVRKYSKLKNEKRNHKKIVKMLLQQLQAKWRLLFSLEQRLNWKDLWPQFQTNQRISFLRVAPMRLPKDCKITRTKLPKGFLILNNETLRPWERRCTTL